MLLQRAVHRFVVQSVLKLTSKTAVYHKPVQKILTSTLGKGLKSSPKNLGRSLHGGHAVSLTGTALKSKFPN